MPTFFSLRKVLFILFPILPIKWGVTNVTLQLKTFFNDILPNLILLTLAKERGQKWQTSIYIVEDGGCRCSSVVEHLPSINKVLDSIPSTHTKKKERERERDI
jgi:hypothetical protein